MWHGPLHSSRIAGDASSHVARSLQECSGAAHAFPFHLALIPSQISLAAILWTRELKNERPRRRSTAARLSRRVGAMSGRTCKSFARIVTVHRSAAMYSGSAGSFPLVV
jgi:hypothetical protein